MPIGPRHVMAGIAILLLGGWGGGRARGSSLPVGGLDIFADHWFRDFESHDDPYHLHHRPRGVLNGPIRVAAGALTITGIDNLDSAPEATAGALMSEVAIYGPFSVGGSVGRGESDTLEWSHAAFHGTLYASPFFAVQAGIVDETWDYPGNTADPANIARNEVNGFWGGATLFGSPAPGFYFHVAASAAPVTAVRTDGVTGDSNFRFRLDGQFGLTVYGTFDIAVLVRATSGLGDQESTAAMAGVAGSLTF